jgi:hypothetical protein
MFYSDPDLHGTVRVNSLGLQFDLYPQPFRVFSVFRGFIRLVPTPHFAVPNFPRFPISSFKVQGSRFNFFIPAPFPISVPSSFI